MREARAPAAAYFVLAEIFSEEFFQRPPPLDGVRLVVEGTDGVRTVWEMSELRALWLHPILQNRPVRISSWLAYSGAT